MIYNLNTSELQVNTGTSLLPVWSSMKGGTDPSVLSVTASNEISTSSTSPVLLTGMTLSPPAGNYLVLFNGQLEAAESEPVSTAQGVIDLQAAYDQLMAIPATNTTHAAVFGNGESLLPGVYD